MLMELYDATSQKGNSIGTDGDEGFGVAYQIFNLTCLSGPIHAKKRKKPRKWRPPESMKEKKTEYSLYSST